MAEKKSQKNSDDKALNRERNPDACVPAEQAIIPPPPKKNTEKK